MTKKILIIAIAIAFIIFNNMTYLNFRSYTTHNFVLAVDTSEYDESDDPDSSSSSSQQESSEESSETSPSSSSSEASSKAAYSSSSNKVNSYDDDDVHPSRAASTSSKIGTASLLPGDADKDPGAISPQDWNELLKNINSNTDADDNFVFSDTNPDNSTSANNGGSWIFWLGIFFIGLSVLGLGWVGYTELILKKSRGNFDGAKSSVGHAPKHINKAAKSNMSAKPAKDSYGDKFNNHSKKPEVDQSASENKSKTPKRDSKFWDNFFEDK